MCLIVAFIFFLIDLVQLGYLGFSKYFHSSQNRRDFGWFFVQCIYSLLKQYDNYDSIVPLQIYWNLLNKHKDEMAKLNRPNQAANVSIQNIFIMQLMNAYLIYIATRKVMFFFTM